MPLLEVENLQTHFHTDEGVARAVDGVSFAMEAGESLALVGESACGKSVTAMSIMRLVRAPGFHPGGSVRLEGQDLMRMEEDALRPLRGNRVSMIFQEPMTSLNPLYTVANQMGETLILHQGMTVDAARRRSLELLEQMGISAPEVVLDSYPHQLSGGMRQRVMIAMAISCRPRLMIADEPTTALDVTVQAQILALIRQLQQEIGMALLLITHDLGVVSQMSDRVCVMYAGRVAETAPRDRLLERPAHPYTVKLMESIPREVGPGGRLSVIPGQVQPATQYGPGCRFAGRCTHAADRCLGEQPPLFALDGGGHGGDEARCACFLHDPENPLAASGNTASPAPGPAKGAAANATPPTPAPAEGEDIVLEVRALSTHFPVRKGFFRRVAGHVRAVDGVDLRIPRGTTLALVGESGCGKTTLGHSLLNLEGAARGEVWFEGENLLALEPERMRGMRQRMQIIFQDPFASLNPRMLVRDIVGEGLLVHEPGLDAAGRATRVAEALHEVGLDANAGSRYAHEFSGGQRQRIAIARAIILRPRFIVLDEATSALDVSVQAQILNLLSELQARHGLTYLFITHDLGVVEFLAGQVAVMYLGRIVEQGPAAAVLGGPAHPYTRNLLASVPRLGRPVGESPVLQGDVPSPMAPPAGCHFHTRCPLFQQAGGEAGAQTWAGLCPAQYPNPSDLGGGHWARCHGLPGNVRQSA